MKIYRRLRSLFLNETVAQTSAFEVCGSSRDSRSQTCGQATVFESGEFCKVKRRPPKPGASLPMRFVAGLTSATIGLVRA
jgi:hypothetical protein